jgi:rhamnogalacturonyl hydrolase YesR
MNSYLKLMEGLLPYQTSDGLWRQLIDYPEAYEETSGSAMFAYAMVTGIRMGWLDVETYLPVAEKAWIGLVNRVDEHGEIADVCIGTNEKKNAEGYLERKKETGDHHGQAPMLWTAQAILQLNKN